MKTEKATFAMGCFWGPQLKFNKTPGVIKTEVGFMGGNEKLFPKPSYKQVVWLPTRYAEVNQITFNPEKISYKKLLEIFWKNHNPTTKNRQGLDIGSQYRSAIFYHSKEQKEQALYSLKKAQKNLDKKIVTQIEKASKFTPAEEYHQKYLEKHGKNTC